MEKGARNLILMSHLGRPDGKIVPEMSLKPVADELGKLLGTRVIFLPDCVGKDVEKAIANSEPGQIFLLENLRFHIEEEGSVKLADGSKRSATPAELAAFRTSLSSLGDVLVNDAFGTMHRAHSSITGIALPKVAGLLVSKELEFFGKIMEADKIDCAILGGSKVSDKIKLIENMLDKVKLMVIGGGMAFTFLHVLKGTRIGKSLFDKDGSALVPLIMEKAKEKGVKILLPVDFVTADKFAADCKVGYATIEEGIPENDMGLDIGAKSIALFSEAIKSCHLVIWNGPMGVFEFEKFSTGTRSILEALQTVTLNGGVSVVGGGDSAAAVCKWHSEDKVSHVSTGGGASLELLEGKILPGVEALDAK